MTLIKYTLATLLLLSSQLVNAVATYQLTDSIQAYLDGILGNVEQVTISKIWPIPADVIGEKWNQLFNN